MDYMFKVLGDDLNEFETSIQRFLQEDDNDVNARYHIGMVAYIPAYVEREAEKRDLAEKSIGSEWLGKVNEKIDLEIEIIIFACQIASKLVAHCVYGYKTSN